MALLLSEPVPEDGAAVMCQPNLGLRSVSEENTVIRSFIKGQRKSVDTDPEASGVSKALLFRNRTMKWLLRRRDGDFASGKT